MIVSPSYWIVAPGMPPPATPMPTSSIGGFAWLKSAAVEYVAPLGALPVPGVRMNAQRVCSAVGSTPVGGCMTAPVIVVPTRLGVTVPVASGIGDSSHLSV